MCDDDKYLSMSGIKPSVWGKSGWKFLNSIALVYNINKKQHYKDFFEALPYVLPCEDCGNDLKENLEGLDEALTSKKRLLDWLCNIRNGVAKKFEGRQLTRKDVILEIFESPIDNTYKYIWVFILILVLILLIFIIKMFRKEK